jgi:osmoprotectant transport system permease protein
MSWIANNLPLIGQLTLAHLATALPPIVLSLIISVPLGWAANRFRWSRGVLLSLLGLLYAIPSFPLFVALPLIIGTGLRDPLNVVIGLTIYGIALMVRSTADGLASVDPDIQQSASAIGFSNVGKFWQVELPLAGPVLLAGLRVVAVSTVSLTTVGAVLGIKSLGLLFTDGILLTIAIALLFDAIIVLIGRLVMPWTRAVAQPGRRSARSQRKAALA